MLKTYWSQEECRKKQIRLSKADIDIKKWLMPVFENITIIIEVR